ncbi:hypothetical protein, partial [Riemerella anatipestifer]|uniref:hypothetical protein n=1 Tax=Riemerella anatipestifer TaxID=34085 RepID=UPI003D9CAA52
MRPTISKILSTFPITPKYRSANLCWGLFLFPPFYFSLSYILAKSTIVLSYNTVVLVGCFSCSGGALRSFC